MAVGVNDSGKQVLSSLWTGIGNAVITAINPTMDQMKAMGMNPQQEPEYKGTKEKDGESWKSIRIDFYLSDPEKRFRGKATFWLEDKERLNKDGNKYQYINKFGQLAWPKGSDTEPNYDWYSKEGLRKAYVGEEYLMIFIKAWANVDLKDACSLDNIKGLFDNDLSEINAIYKTIPRNQVQVLLGVKDGKYQDVYTKYFDRPYRKGLEQWKKALEGDYGAFKSDYQSDLHLKPYEGNSTVVGDSPTSFSTPPSNGGPANVPYKF